MTDDSTRHDGLADVINLIAAPIAGGIRTVEQLRRGVDEMFRAVDNLNRTMENLNEAATRINRFLGDVEEPVRALIPQITRTVQAAEQITSMIEGPVRATAPNVEKIVNALSSPGFLALPTQVGELMQRLAPLTALAENAGGLFGGFRLPGMPKAPSAASSAPSAPTAPVVPLANAAAKPAKSTKSTKTKSASRPRTGAKASTKPSTKRAQR